MDLDKMLEDLESQPVEVLYELKEKVDAALQRIIHDEIRAAKQKLAKLTELAESTPRPRRTYTRRSPVEEGGEKRGRGRPRKIVPPTTEETSLVDMDVENTLSKLRAITGGESEEHADAFDDGEDQEETENQDVIEDLSDAPEQPAYSFKNPVDDELTDEEKAMEEKIEKVIKSKKKA